MKHIRRFNQINEEVPYNFEKGEENLKNWTNQEKQTLEELGADKIGTNFAIFSDSGLVLTTTKLEEGKYKLNTNKKLKYEDNSLHAKKYYTSPHLVDADFNDGSIYNWNKLLKRIHWVFELNRKSYNQ